MAGKTHRKKAKGGKPAAGKHEADYRHPEAQSPLRPEVGTQAQFRKKKPPVTYRYDSSLSPALDWDGQNPAREQGEAAIREILHLDTAAIDTATTVDEAKKAARAAVIKAKAAAENLKRLGKTFLNWAGKAERLSFDVPTLPLFVHERLSTKAIIETLKVHEKRLAQTDMFDLFGDPKRSIADQVLKAYEYKDKWVNRLILGDFLVVMNSLLHYEGLGGQVQMIYIDPPYGVKFGSNFQPFVRRRDVSHNDDDDMTREPEMVKAYRDTWELGLHSYLTFLRDRLLLAHDLLHPGGSLFVQISDENLHHVRELMDEQFGGENFVSIIAVQKTTGATSELLASTCDFVIWYAKDRERCKFRRLFTFKLDGINLDRYDQLELPEGARRSLTAEEKDDPERAPPGARRFRLSDLTSTRPPGDFPVAFDSKTYRPRTGFWKTGPEGFERLIGHRRVVATDGGTLAYVRYLDDWPCAPVGNLWDDISGSVQSRSDPKVYVVQTSTQLVQRCILMTTDPGDLVLDQ